MNKQVTKPKTLIMYKKIKQAIFYASTLIIKQLENKQSTKAVSYLFR